LYIQNLIEHNQKLLLDLQGKTQLLSKRGVSSLDSFSAHTNYKVIIAKERTYKEKNTGKKGKLT